ncbi:fascin domain-containing protein [Kitasatospora sp. NPDC101183]|uniref:fascin domain-containing protein n=1 Tax=Kitasatospora sp. NPDC101183 TaxID=3364100 RepID=UPI003804B898
MPLTTSDLAKLNGATIAIQSASAPNVYLRMDGTGVVTPTASGGGTVNSQSGINVFAVFRLRPQPDGSYAVESVAYPNVFLRIEPGAISAGQPVGGKVNCQASIGPSEKFFIVAQPNGTLSFLSAGFQNIYLRLVPGAGTTPGGTVNCQVGVGAPNTTFILDKA